MVMGSMRPLLPPHQQPALQTLPPARCSRPHSSPSSVVLYFSRCRLGSAESACRQNGTMRCGRSPAAKRFMEEGDGHGRRPGSDLIIPPAKPAASASRLSKSTATRNSTAVSEGALGSAAELQVPLKHDNRAWTSAMRTEPNALPPRSRSY